MPTVVTFGELMLRLKPKGVERLLQASSLEATFGGGEANVAASLALLGYETRFVTALPPHPIGDWAVAELRKLGVDTRFIARRGSRIGIYYLEAGASQRASQVIYDRAHSALSEMPKDSIDWSAAFSDARWFHTTGITPALGKLPREATRFALRKAKEAGLSTSVDLNFRAKLWTPSEANDTMCPLMEHTDLLIANEEDCARVFGIEADATNVTEGELDREGYVEVASRIFERFPRIEKVAITLRESINASINGWSALLVDRAGHDFGARHEIHVVDRVGAGDSFAAGLISALLDGKSRKKAIDFAVAASALKHTIVGDINLSTKAEVEKLAAGDGSGRVAR